MADGALGEDRLAEIEARAAKASLGPWTASPGGWVDRVPHASVNRTPFRHQEDAQFIAHSRADVPGLLAEVRRLRAEVASRAHAADGLAEAIRAWDDCASPEGLFAVQSQMAAALAAYDALVRAVGGEGVE